MRTRVSTREKDVEGGWIDDLRREGADYEGYQAVQMMILLKGIMLRLSRR